MKNYRGFKEGDGKEAAFRAAIQAGNFEVKHEADCNCGFDWEIVGGQLRDVGESDYCWVGNILYVAGEGVFQNISGEPLESTGDLDVQAILEDMDRYDILEEVTRLDEKEESPEHIDREHESLVEWLEESGYDLYIRYPRNFGNEYDCILAAKGREPEEDWEPQTPEQWASEYLRRPDTMTQVFRGFVLAE